MEQQIISVDGRAMDEALMDRQQGEGSSDDEDGRSEDDSDWGQGLPSEVLEAVFLGLQECFIGGPACARLACKRWAGAFAAAWPQLTPPGDFPPLPGWAQRSFRGLTELDLSCCGPDTLRRFLRETQLLPRLECLRLPNCCGDDDLDGALRGLRKLSSLSLRHCKELTDEGLYRSLQGGGGGEPPPLSRLDLFGCSRVTEAALEALEGLPLTELDLGRCDLSSLATLSSVPALKRLGIGYCRALSDSDLAALPAALPNLRSLDLYECIGLTDACVETHIAGLSGLEELHLAFGDSLTDRGVAALRPLTELQTLNLYATAVTPRGVCSLPFLGRLLTLNLGGTEAASDQGIASLASVAPSLTSLTVARGLITDSGLESLQALTGLRTLSLRDNPAVSDQGLPRLLPLPLTSLDLSFCHEVTGAGLQESLCKMRRLEELSLEGCYLVCPEGLMALTVLSSLRSLNLVGCDQVDDGVAEDLQECFEQEEALAIFL